MKLEKGMIRLWLAEGVADPDLGPIPGLVQMDPGQVVLAAQVATRYGLRTSFFVHQSESHIQKII